MKNTTCLSKYILFFYVNILFCANLTAQPRDHPVYDEPNTVNGPVQSVSSRISIMYSTDEQIVESYVQAAVSLAERTGIAAPVVVAIAYKCVIEGLMKTDLEPGYSMDPNWGQNVLGIIVKMELSDLDR